MLAGVSLQRSASTRASSGFGPSRALCTSLSATGWPKTEMRSTILFPSVSGPGVHP